MEKKKYIEPKMKAVELDPASIICLSQTGGTATQSLDDYDATPTDNGKYRPYVIFD